MKGIRAPDLPFSQWDGHLQNHAYNMVWMAEGIPIHVQREQRRQERSARRLQKFFKTVQFRARTRHPHEYLVRPAYDEYWMRMAENDRSWIPYSRYRVEMARKFNRVHYKRHRAAKTITNFIRQKLARYKLRRSYKRRKENERRAYQQFGAQIEVRRGSRLHNTPESQNSYYRVESDDEVDIPEGKRARIERVRPRLDKSRLEPARPVINRFKKMVRDKRELNRFKKAKKRQALHILIANAKRSQLKRRRDEFLAAAEKELDYPDWFTDQWPAAKKRKQEMLEAVNHVVSNGLYDHELQTAYNRTKEYARKIAMEDLFKHQLS